MAAGGASQPHDRFPTIKKKTALLLLFALSPSSLTLPLPPSSLFLQHCCADMAVVIAVAVVVMSAVAVVVP